MLFEKTGSKKHNDPKTVGIILCEARALKKNNAIRIVVKIRAPKVQSFRFFFIPIEHPRKARPKMPPDKSEIKLPPL